MPARNQRSATAPQESEPQQGRTSLLSALVGAMAQQKAIIDELLSRESPPQGEELHDLRVALRRLASLARLARGFPRKDGACRLRKAARNLRRDLSLQRTLEISYSRLRQRFARDRERRTAARLLADRILPGGRHEEVASAEKVEKLKSRLSKRYAKRIDQLESAQLILDLETHDATLSRLFTKRLLRMRAALTEIGIPDGSSLHAFRIATKDLRYALEFLEGHSEPLKDLRKALKYFQDVAGDAHDRIELVALVSECSRKDPGACKAAAESLLPKLEVDATRAIARSRRLAARLLSQLESTSLELPSPG